MTKTCSRRTVLYGEVIDKKGRRQIEEISVDPGVGISWQTEPILFDSNAGVSLVFVDLDNPDLAVPEFLISVATAGEGVTVVGKATTPTLELSQIVSKYGVAEILPSDQCLTRLHDFLKELEEPAADTMVGASKYSVDALIGVSPQMAEIRKTLTALAQVDFPSALILGETGSGKSLISKILHHAGVRAQRNLVEVNCSAIPDDLFETELFGHSRGAFTDAKHDKIGLFEYAQDGTLFLDEVGNLSPMAQAKLLKILEDKKLRKIGEVEECDINVRVVTATNLDLEKAIAEGTFREDLYYRLNLLTVHVPPLRERPEDISCVVEHFLKLFSSLYGKPATSIDDKAMQQMSEYSWPGNIRELSNVIERAVLLTSSKVIHPKDIKTALSNSRLTPVDRRKIMIDIPAQGISLDEIEQNVVMQILSMFQWNKTEAAKFLDISRPRLRRIIGDAGLEQNRRSR
jgi:two-component system response regulator AtoC